MSGSQVVFVHYVIRREETLDGVRVSIGMDDADVRVSAGASIELGKDSEKMRQEDAIHAAVADDEDGLAGALARETIDRTQRARQGLIERLPTWPRDETVVVPVCEAARLVEGLPRSVAAVDLAQVRHHFDRNA